MDKILVSACLLGHKCKYHGGDNEDTAIKALSGRYELLPVCPEIAGGLGVPRPPAEIRGGQGDEVLDNLAVVLDKEGHDVTSQFIKGACKTLELAKSEKAKKAILKEGSPSCGSSMIYDGTFSGRKKEGRGVTAALLARNGIEVRSELDGKPTE